MSLKSAGNAKRLAHKPQEPHLPLGRARIYPAQRCVWVNVLNNVAGSAGNIQSLTLARVASLIVGRGIEKRQIFAKKSAKIKIE